MATSASGRISTFQQRTRVSDGRPSSRGGDAKAETKKEIWSSMLSNVSSGKRLPEKTLLVLGGTPETQKDFLESLETDPTNKRRPTERNRKPPVANQFALGYTFQDVVDAEHEDIIARLSLYLLTDPSPSFTPLIKPIMNPKTLQHMLIVVLLDWAQPWLFLRQLRSWIRVLRSLIASLDDECKDILEENINRLRDKSRNTGMDPSSLDTSVEIPLGPGEWDEPLGLPLCVVCQNADKIEGLEREQGWKEEEFDFILQYIRTVLLKHGASLVYTMPSAPGDLQTLVHSILGIQSSLKRKELRHDVIHRDSVLIPPNWDSWGKIRILREGFDVEGVSTAWSVDIQAPPERRRPAPTANGEANGDHDASTVGADIAPSDEEDEEHTAVAMYEESIQAPISLTGAITTLPKHANGLEVETTDTQAFLTGQLKVLEQLREEDAAAKATQARRAPPLVVSAPSSGSAGSGVVEDHIGPVQFNMGGIQVDAEDMVRKLKDREANRSSETTTEATETPASGASGTDTEENEKLKNFFAGLMKKSGAAATAAGGGANPAGP